MKPHIGLTEKHFNTRFAPLCLVGNALRTQKTLDALANIELKSMKTRTHRPGEKLIDAFLLIMAGYPSLYLLNQHLRPDHILAQAWQREQLTEQSSISRTLDRIDADGLVQLQQISRDFWHQHSQLHRHDWRKRLLIDLDLTPLPASKWAEDSTKGYLGEKTQLGDNWHG